MNQEEKLFTTQNIYENIRKIIIVFQKSIVMFVIPNKRDCLKNISISYIWNQVNVLVWYEKQQ